MYNYANDYFKTEKEVEASFSGSPEYQFFEPHYGGADGTLHYDVYSG